MRERPFRLRNIIGGTRIRKKEGGIDCRAATGPSRPRARTAPGTKNKKAFTIHACRKIIFHSGRNRGGGSIQASVWMGISCGTINGLLALWILRRMPASGAAHFPEKKKPAGPFRGAGGFHERWRRAAETGRSGPGGGPSGHPGGRTESAKRSGRRIPNYQTGRT